MGKKKIQAIQPQAPEAQKRYGIWQEETIRHGRCWRYNVRVLNEEGKLQRKTASGFATKAECETAVAALRLAARENKYGLARPKAESLTTVGDAVESYIQALTARWAAGHGARYAARSAGQTNPIRRWAEFVGAEKAVKNLTKQDFLLWTQSEIARGQQPASVQRRLNNIRAALNYARETSKDLREFKIPRYSLGKSSFRERMRILDEAEIRAIAAELQTSLGWRDAYDFFRVALGSGGRFDEIAPVVIRRDMTTAGIKWSDINKKQNTLRLFSGKTGKERTIYVPAVINVLLERKKAGLGDKIHAFTCRDHFIRKVFAKASKICDILYGQKTPGGWTVHDLRHTCLTNLLQSGVDLATVRDFAGHASIAKTSKYVHATVKSKQILAEASHNLIAFTRQ